MSKATRRVARGVLVLLGILLALGLIETALRVIEPRLPPEKRFTLPPNLEKKSLQGKDYLWHGHVHRFNSQEFRGGEWPPRRTNVFRILVMGDSFTYGFGVDEARTYPALLEKKLGQQYRVEVLNLGRSGAQSEDIAWLTAHFLPKLKPDLVIYGICLNDFLPTGMGQYRRIAGVKVPETPPAKTRMGIAAGAALHRGLIKLGIEKDFVQDALDASTRYAERFQRDVSVLNAFVVSRIGLPVVAMVLNQIPDNPGALELVLRCEASLQQAGLIVIPAEPYLKKWTGRSPLIVSPWETHPNEEAHAAFANTLLHGIEENAALTRRMAPFKKL